MQQTINTKGKTTLKTITEQIRRFDAIDGTFYLINRPDGSLLGKAYSQADAELLASAPMLKAKLDLVNRALNFIDAEIRFAGHSPERRLIEIASAVQRALNQTAGQIGGEK